MKMGYSKKIDLSMILVAINIGLNHQYHIDEGDIEISL
jgi:hypothetical protein